METIQYVKANMLRTEVEILGEKPTSGLKGPLLKQLTLARNKLVKSLVHFSDEQARQVYDRRGFTFQKLSGPAELIKEFEALEATRLGACMKEEAEFKSQRKWGDSSAQDLPASVRDVQSE